MSAYTGRILDVSQRYKRVRELKNEISSMKSKLDEMRAESIDMLEAQQLLVTVSDDATSQVLDYIAGIVNKTLAELFPYDPRRIVLQKQMYQGKYAHVNIQLTAANGKTRDFLLQSGNGLGQVTSFIFLQCVIEVCKARRLFLMDELLHGLHPEAKRVVKEIMKLFVEEGYQYAMVEYGVNDLGKIYLVEKPGDTSTVTPMDGVYADQVFVYNPPVDYDASKTEEEG